MPMNLPDLYRETRTLTIGPAGEGVRVFALRVRDLAELGRLGDDRRGWALDCLALPPGSPERARGARAAFLDLEADQSAATGRVDLMERAIDLVWLALRRGVEGMTREDAAAVLLGLTGDQYLQLRAVALALPEGELLQQEIDPDFAPEAPGQGTPWPEAIDELARERHWTYDQIGEMTLAAFGSARRHGREPRTAGAAVPAGMDLAEFAERQRRKFYGEDGGEAGHDG